MQLSDKVTLGAPRDRVVAALTDAATLQACIPGCTSVTALEGGRFEVVMSIPTGLRPMTLNGVVRIDQAEAPERLTILRGGQARADIAFSEVAGRTVVAYDARAEIGGRAAMLGSRMLAGVARRVLAGFFARLETELARTR